MNSVNFRIFEFTNTPVSSLNFSEDSLEVKDEEKENIYILLTGRWGGNHDAPNLTDTLILVWINSKKETITMLSIPRDLYVDFPETSRSWKINQIYESSFELGKDIAIQRLKQKITEVTGKQIDFYIDIDFQWFIEVVDTLWGVDVTLEENLVDYEYPDGYLWYKTFILRKWTWTLDGEVSLMYARSRHSTSDFDRSRRQQQIISSLREKIANLWYFRDRKKIAELYEILKQYVDTDMALGDMISLWLTLKSWQKPQTLSFNLNDTCYLGSPDCSVWGLLYVPLREYFGGASVLLPNGATYFELESYDEVQYFSSLIYDYPEIYSSPEDIRVFNTTNIAWLAAETVAQLQPYWFSGIIGKNSQNIQEKKFEKSILYYNNVQQDHIILQSLKELLDIELVQTDAPISENWKERFEIILAPNDNS